MLMIDCQFQKEEKNDFRSWAGVAVGLGNRDMRRCGLYLTAIEGCPEVPRLHGE